MRLRSRHSDMALSSPCVQASRVGQRPVPDERCWCGSGCHEALLVRVPDDPGDFAEPFVFLGRSLCVEQPNCRRRSRWCAMVGPRLAGSPGLESASVDGGSGDPCGHSANDLSRSLNAGDSTCSAASASTSRLTVAAAAFLCDRRPRRPPGAVPSDVERRAAGLQRQRRHPHLLRYGITRSTTFSRARVL